MLPRRLVFMSTLSMPDRREHRVEDRELARREVHAPAADHDAPVIPRALRRELRAISPAIVAHAMRALSSAPARGLFIKENEPWHELRASSVAETPRCAGRLREFMPSSLMFSAAWRQLGRRARACELE